MLRQEMLSYLLARLRIDNLLNFASSNVLPDQTGSMRRFAEDKIIAVVAILSKNPKKTDGFAVIM